MKIPVYWVDYGIASILENKETGEKWIEINENLLEYPDLLKKILKHEAGHIDSDKTIDLMHDIGEVNLIDPEILRFCFKHPKAFKDFFPILKTRNGYSINWMTLGTCVFLVGVVFILIFLFTR